MTSKATLGAICESVVQGGNPEFVESGVPCLNGKNIYFGTASAGEPNYVTAKAYEALKEHQLRKRDIVVTLKHASKIGRAWIIEEDGPCTFSRNIGLIRLKPDAPIKATTLVFYLWSRLCQLTLERLATGGTSGQITLATTPLKQLPVPIFGELETHLESLYHQARSLAEKQEKLLAAAQDALLASLGLKGWEPPEPLTYTRRASDVLDSGRIDAEHFRPKFDALIHKMEKHGQVVRLGDCLRFCERGRQPDYAEEGLPVLNSRHIQRDKVLLDADNRRATEDPAQQKLDEEDRLTIKQGDVLINGTGVGTMGRCAPYLESGKALPDNHVTILRIKPETELEPVFLSVQLNSIIGQMQVEQYFKGSSGQIELYPTEIKEFRIWLAPPKIQQQIKSQLEQAHQSRQEAQALLAQAKRAVEVAIEDGEEAALKIMEGLPKLNL